MAYEKTLYDDAVASLYEVVDELGLPRTENMPALLSKLDMEDLESQIGAIIKRTVGPIAANAVLDAKGVPRVYAVVDLESHDPAFDLTVVSESMKFDCTAALEWMSNHLPDGIPVEDFLGWSKEEDGFYEDLDFEELDELYRVSARLGMVREWDGPVSCHLSNGWAAWANDRLTRHLGAAGPTDKDD